MIKEGGVASGFAHVETNNYSEIRRLLHVKGKSKIYSLNLTVKVTCRKFEALMKSSADPDFQARKMLSREKFH